MKDLTNESLFNLANRLNEINKEIDVLEIEYNSVVKEIKRRLSNSKDDENLKPKVLRKVKGENNGK